MFNSKKVIAMVLSFVMMLGFTTSAFASTPEVNIDTIPTTENANNLQNIQSDSTVEVNDETMQPLGLKKFFAEEAIKGISKGLKAGANNKWVKKAITDYFDAKTAKVFKTNLVEISYVLDDAVRYSQLSEEWIEDGIYSLIYGYTKNHGVSHAIADGVTGLISVFL
ncbi:hypothetical protein [Psychrobacillus sp. FSL H8-0510]|uniref:hypothetical protein n=1 Tax=Psychrobacillus sp. FSL H8-0510 TaxID=2921394 RepID=UPI0030F8F016